MGTWGIGFFENDMACDWEKEIKENTHIQFIEDAFTPILHNDEEDLDIDLANRGLAALETLARIINKDGKKDSYTEEVDSWIERISEEIPIGLREMALETLDKIIDKNSELYQFWNLRGEISNWLLETEKLKARLID